MIEQALQRLWYERIMPAMASIVTGLVFHSRIRVGSEGQNNRDVLSHDVEGLDVEGQDSQGQPLQQAQMDARAAEVAGFAVVPIPKEPALVLGWGANLAVIPLASKKYRPKGLKGGTVAMYNLHSQQGTIIIRADSGKEGQIEITAPSPRDVVVNGGTKKVSRVGDKTKGHTHTAAFNLTANLVSGAVTGTITIASATDEMAEGAEHFKG